MSGLKKFWFVLIIVVVILVVSLLVLDFNKNNVQNNNENGLDGDSSKDITEVKQGTIEVTNVTMTKNGDTTNVGAQVTNKDNKKYSIVDVSIIFYDESRNVLATAKGLIENIEKDETKSFYSSIGGDFTKNSSYEVKIEKAE